MSFRIADITSRNNAMLRIQQQRLRISDLQEELTTGKRINRPSDDPGGSATVLNLRTSQAEIAQYLRISGAADEKLTVTDDSINNYQTMLDRVRTLVAQGLSGTATQPAKDALATEIETISNRILSIANGKSGGIYIFGGSRQTAPPYDPVAATRNANVAAQQYMQIEPGSNAIPVGVTAEQVFADTNGTIFEELAGIVTSLRGTGNAAADEAALHASTGRLEEFANLSNTARSTIGASMNTVESAQANLSSSFAAMDQRASNIEDADYAASAIAFTDAQNALEATLQVIAKGRRSLMDYLE